MRLNVQLRFADGHTQQVTVTIADPAAILNDESGSAGRLLGDLATAELVEAHGPIVAPPRIIPSRAPRRDSFPNHNRVSRSAVA